MPYLLLCQEVDPVLLRRCGLHVHRVSESCIFRTLSTLQYSFCKAKGSVLERLIISVPWAFSLLKLFPFVVQSSFSDLSRMRVKL